MVEAFSVIIQVASFRLTGSASSACRHSTPLRARGVKEPQIIIRFWIVAFIFALFTLMTLKLR